MEVERPWNWLGPRKKEGLQEGVIRCLCDDYKELLITEVQI
jgi:hypothetical protein